MSLPKIDFIFYWHRRRPRSSLKALKNRHPPVIKRKDCSKREASPFAANALICSARNLRGLILLIWQTVDEVQ